MSDFLGFESWAPEVQNQGDKENKIVMVTEIIVSVGVGDEGVTAVSAKRSWLDYSGSET